MELSRGLHEHRRDEAEGEVRKGGREGRKEG